MREKKTEKKRKENRYCCHVLAQSFPVQARLSGWLKLGWILTEETKTWLRLMHFFGAKRLLFNVYLLAQFARYRRLKSKSKDGKEILDAL
jgi:hypothetical protein